MSVARTPREFLARPDAEQRWLTRRILGAMHAALPTWVCAIPMSMLKAA